MPQWSQLGPPFQLLLLPLGLAEFPCSVACRASALSVSWCYATSGRHRITVAQRWSIPSIRFSDANALRSPGLTVAASGGALGVSSRMPLQRRDRQCEGGRDEGPRRALRAPPPS